MVNEADPRRQIRAVQNHIAACCRAAGRSDTPRLVAVTKTRPAQDLAPLAAEGIHDYGENRLEHLQEMLPAAPAQSRFHYLGRVQSRQFPEIVRHCRVLHSLATNKHVPRLAAACRREGAQLEVFCQVNMGLEPHKAGVTPAELPRMLEALAAESEVLQVLGLMTMAPDTNSNTFDEDDVRRCFAGLRELASQHHLPRLSMGMSGDYPIAIAEGATDLRIGGALFPPA